MTLPDDHRVEDLLRELAPQVLGALVRRYGHFDVAEDAVQESLLAAVTQWPVEGRPDNPKGWLIRVGSRRMTDLLRAEQARLRRENTVASRVLPEDYLAPAPDAANAVDQDDSLVLLLMCCHPALSTTSQIALTLRAVGGLTTGEIARALLVPESTLAQRISRAKQSVRDAGARFSMPPRDEVEGRLAVVLHVLYLIFNEGYTASSGPYLVRHDLALEAIRLARLVHRVRPTDDEVAGLLALMLLTDARRPARTRPDGELVPLAEQDRTLWDVAAIAQGVALIRDAMSGPARGPYQVQAAIAAVHAQASDTDSTNWVQILALYGELAEMSDNPMVRLNQAVAASMVHGPASALGMLDGLDDDPRMKGTHRVDAVRAHLLERAGDQPAAVERYLAAARRTTSTPERHYLEKQAARLRAGNAQPG